MSYGRETTGTCEADGTPTPIHRLVVYHLKGAWTTRNRDVAFALFNSLVKNQVIIMCNIFIIALKLTQIFLCFRN